MLSLFMRNYQLIVGLCNQACNIIIPFIITFIPLKILSPELGSIWLIFLSMVILVSLFDFGLSPTIIRNISYVIAGAKSLSVNSLAIIDSGSTVSYPLLGRLINDIKKIYKKLTFFAAVLILFFGSLYFYYISPVNDRLEVLISWWLFSAGLLMSLYYLYFTPILTGFGQIQKSNLANMYGRLCWLAITLAFIPVGLNLINLSFSFFASIVITRFLTLYYFKKNAHFRQTQNESLSEDSTIPYISGSAIKLGLATIGNVIINRGPIIIAGIAFNLSLAGAFTLTTQIFLAIISVSNVYLAIQLPILSQLVIKNEKEKVRKVVLKILIYSVLLYLLGVTIFFSTSGLIIDLTGTKVSFLESKYILLMGVIYFLDLVHNISASILTTGNKIPFVIPVIISGILISIIAWVLVFPFKMGALGLIAAQGLVQLSYNNWRWPYLVYSNYIKTH